MAKIKYGEASAGFADAIAQMKAQAATVDALEAKLAQLNATEASSTGVTRGNITARLDSAAAIQQQIAALSGAATALERETILVGEATAAWRRYAFSRGEAAAALGPGLSPALSRPPQTALPAGESRLLAAGPPVYPPGYYMGQPGALRLGEQPRGGPFVGGPGGLARATTRTSCFAGASGEFDTVPIGQYSVAEEKLLAVNARAQASIAGVGAEQIATNRAFNQSVAEYSSSSQALTRHGALSTEFIQSFARGETTLKEFGSALTATIGKFAGWAVAGGLVYGAFEALKKVSQGATETATGVAQLERAGLPDFNKEKAEEGFREMAQRTNVPIKAAADAQFYATRAGFRTMPESLAVGETALKAEKLDQVPIQEATKAFGALHASFDLNSKDIGKLFDLLDVGQLKFNARLNQTLPMMGRAASSIANAGGNATALARQLIEVTGITGGGGGQGGGNPATLFIRESANLARPAAINTLRERGLDAYKGLNDITKFNEEIQEKAKNWTTDQKREVAKAIGGGSALGGRYGIALVQSGPSGRAAEVKYEQEHSAGSAERDMRKKLGQLDEQVASVGHTFERVGSEIGRSGITNVGEDFIHVLYLMSEGVEKSLHPLEKLGNLFAVIPKPLQDLAVAAAVLGGGLRFARSDKALGLSGPLGEVPGLGALDSEPKQQLRASKRTISDALARQTSLIESAATNELSASERRMGAVGAKSAFLGTPESQRLSALGASGGAGASSEEVMAFNAKVAAYDDAINVAAAREVASREALVAQFQIRDGLVAQQAILEDKHLTAAERNAKFGATGGVAAGRGGPLVAESGLVGAEAEARARTAAGGAAVTGSLDKTAVGVVEGGAVVGSSFTQAGLQIREGGSLVGSSLMAAAGKIAAGGSLAAAGEAGAGAGAGLTGIWAGTRGAAGSMLSGMGGKLFGGLMVASIGSMVAEMAGSAIGGKAGKTAGSIGSDVAMGAGVGMLFGAPEVGAALGGIYGAAKEFGGGTQEQSLDGMTARFKKEMAKAKTRAEKPTPLTGSEKNAAYLEETAENFGAEIEKAFKDESEGAQKARANIEKAMKVSAANLKLFGESSPRGLKVEEIMGARLTAMVTELAKHPGTVDQAAPLIEATQAAVLGPAKEQLTRSLKTAKTPQEAQAALRQSEVTAQNLYNQSIRNPEKGLTSTLAQQSAVQGALKHQLTAVEAEPAGQRTVQPADIRKRLEAASKEVQETKEQLQRFREMAPRINQQINEFAHEEAPKLAYESLVSKDATGNALKLARAGNNAKARAKAEADIEGTNRGYAEETFKGKSPENEKNLRNEQAAAQLARRQKLEGEGLEKLDTRSALAVASLPVGTTTVTADKLKASAAAKDLSYIKSHQKNNEFTWKQLADAMRANVEAQKAVEEAVLAERSSRAQILSQIAQARDQGNAVAQAGDAAALAHKMLGYAKNEEQRNHAILEGINASNQLQQAQQARIAEEGELAKSLTTDPVKAASIDVATARKQLAGARGPDERIKDEAALNNAKKNQASALVSNREREISFQLEMHKISTQQAIQQLDELLRVHNLAKQTRESILSQVRKLEEGAASGSGSYNFGPGGVKLPTIYDVHRAMGQALSGAHARTAASLVGSMHQTNQITVNVTKASDVPAVAEALDRVTHSGLKARLRRYGLK